MNTLILNASKSSKFWDHKSYALIPNLTHQLDIIMLKWKKKKEKEHNNGSDCCWWYVRRSRQNKHACPCYGTVRHGTAWRPRPVQPRFIPVSALLSDSGRWLHLAWIIIAGPHIRKRWRLVWIVHVDSWNSFWLRENTHRCLHAPLPIKQETGKPWAGSAWEKQRGIFFFMSPVSFRVY